MLNILVSKRRLLCSQVIRRSFNSKTTSQMAHNPDDRLEVFGAICGEIGQESSYIGKAKILRNFFRDGNDGKGFNGDMLLWVQMLIPSTNQRVYNLQNKQMLKLFSRILATDLQQMHLDLEQDGDVSETIQRHFESSKALKPQSASTLFLQDVDKSLENLEKKTKEDEQTAELRQLCAQATSNDLKLIIRLIKQDLRINAGPRHILDAFGPLAYPAFQSTRNLKVVIEQYASTLSPSQKIAKLSKKLTGKKSGGVEVMTPVSPMLANACKSVDEAFKKSPSGIYTEVKYDGERVQIHKRGEEFKFFSRNLKPVLDHKVKGLKQFIPKAFPGGENMILDSEIILVDTVSGNLLPFGTLGAHKKKEHANAEICMFVFDCILFNDEDLTETPLKERRKILEDHIQPIQFRVQLSESNFLTNSKELAVMTAKVLQANLEGVVLKNPSGTYQPGKRGWLKVKKDYLFGGKMADTADLVVLGAWFGSGKKGGILSIFLMGCFDANDKLWKTVCKVHSGLDDATNDKIHDELMNLMERANGNKLPAWFLCNRALAPDYIAKNPTLMPVWEITGAEFTKSEAHTAAGISIRFPRITKLRDDKSASQANDVQLLAHLYEVSKQSVNVDLLMASSSLDNDTKNEKIALHTKINVSPKGPKKRDIVCANETKNEDDNGCNSKKVKQSPTPRKAINNNVNKSPKKLEKQLTLNFSVQKPTNKVESDLFKGMIAYFTDNLNENKNMFINNGGKITKDTYEANVIFHSSELANGDLSSYRVRYDRTSRHVHIKWIHDSTKANMRKEFAEYAVVLR